MQSNKDLLCYTGFCYIDKINKYTLAKTVLIKYSLRELYDEENCSCEQKDCIMICCDVVIARDRARSQNRRSRQGSLLLTNMIAQATCARRLFGFIVRCLPTMQPTLVPLWERRVFIVITRLERETERSFETIACFKHQHSANFLLPLPSISTFLDSW